MSSVIYEPNPNAPQLPASALEGLDNVIDTINGGRHATAAEVGARLGAVAKRRFDSVFTDLGKLDPAKRKVISERATEFAQRADNQSIAKQIRFDSMNAAQRADSDGFWFVRELSHILSRTWQEKYPAQTAWDLFGRNEAVPAGAREFIARRTSARGEARIYRAGTNVPIVKVARSEMTFNIRTLVTSTSTDIFEQAAASFGGFDKAAQEMAGAKRILMERANEIFWRGDTNHQLFGMLNYPFTSEMYSATPFVASSSADDMLDALNTAANFPEEQSNTVLRCDSVVMAPRIYNILAQKQRSAASDTTVLEYWIKTNAQGIRNVSKAHELQAAGPGSEDGLFFYRQGPTGPLLTVPQPFAVLPAQQVGFQSVTLMYMTIGSPVMEEPGEQVIVWSPAA
jgi:hypothetical protein